MGAVSKMAKENKRKSDRESYRWYAAAGICPRCHSWCKPGRVHCEKCLAEMIAKSKERDPTGEIKRKQDRERARKRVEAGLCPKCGKKKPDNGVQLCDACRQAARDSKIKMKIKRHTKLIEQGIIIPSLGREGRHAEKNP